MSSPIKFPDQSSKLNPSEPLKPAEVVKFADQVRKIFGWIRKLFIILFVSSALLTIYSCTFGRAVVRIINSIPIPEPNPTSTPFPIPIIPTPTPAPIPTNEPEPTSTITPTQTPIPQNCAGNQFLDVRDGKCKLKPILGFWKVQGFNPKQTEYNCHNPKDGPKFQTNKICVKDSTLYLCDPLNPGNCGPCDTDHLSFWNTFCHERDYDNFNGPDFHVSNAQAIKSEENSFYTNIHFLSGVQFRFCVFPPKDFKTKDGISLEIKANAETCVSETY